jgi:hypothetical protein
MFIRDLQPNVVFDQFEVRSETQKAEGLGTNVSKAFVVQFKNDMHRVVNVAIYVEFSTVSSLNRFDQSFAPAPNRLLILTSMRGPHNELIQDPTESDFGSLCQQSQSQPGGKVKESKSEKRID